MHTPHLSRLAAINRRARKAFDLPKSAPVGIAFGSDRPPVFTGERAHYETGTGQWIWHPSAYSRKGWSSTRYVPSTGRVIVGDRWEPALS